MTVASLHLRHSPSPSCRANARQQYRVVNLITPAECCACNFARRNAACANNLYGVKFIQISSFVETNCPPHNMATWSYAQFAKVTVTPLNREIYVFWHCQKQIYSDAYRSHRRMQNAWGQRSSWPLQKFWIGDLGVPRPCQWPLDYLAKNSRVCTVWVDQAKHNNIYWPRKGSE